MAAVSSSGRVRPCRRLVRAACRGGGGWVYGVGATLCGMPSRPRAFRVMEQGATIESLGRKVEGKKKREKKKKEKGKRKGEKEKEKGVGKIGKILGKTRKKIRVKGKRDFGGIFPRFEHFTS
jgi:hypothetical protein